MLKSMFGTIIRPTSFMTSTRPPLVTNLTSVLRRCYVSKTVYVSNVPWSSNEQMLRDLGTKYGEVSSVRLPLDFEGRVRGFAFIEYDDEESAQKAIDNINGYELDGRQLRAAEATGARSEDSGRGRRGRFGRGFGRENSDWQDRRRTDFGEE